MKYIREMAIILAVLAIGYLWIQSNRKQQLIDRYDRIDSLKNVSFDSVVQLHHQADLHAIRMATERDIAVRELKAEHSVTNKYRYENQALRRRPILRYDDSTITSKWARFYPR